jgi:hypothetical protein
MKTLDLLVFFSLRGNSIYRGKIPNPQKKRKKFVFFNFFASKEKIKSC